MSLFNIIDEFVSSLDQDDVGQNRKDLVQPLIDFIQEKVLSGEEIRLNFICTHNSRRSHLSQVWAQTMADHFGIKNVYCYSGGTESTAVFPKVIETLQGTGFEVEALSEEENPIYSIKYGENVHPLIAFSKKYDSDFNPKTGFAAVMTCSSADQGCPFVVGAELRVPITYEDPKLFDGTDFQTEKYLERSTQIATEMKYIFSRIQI